MIVEELRRRKVEVELHNSAGDEVADVAVVAEWDTFYGRALPLSFASAASGKDVLELANGDATFPHWIHPFVYLRGIDGKTAEGAGNSTPAKPAPEHADRNQEILKTRTPSELPEGLNQADYIRRLADQLVETDSMLRGQGKPGLKAVGILGTDVYDTLLILRALHDRLPDVLYFSTELDARYSIPDEWAAVHNLVVVAPFGLRLHGYYQHNIPPFRDTNQTAVFYTAQVAVQGEVKFTDDHEPHQFPPPLGAPRIFEIGRSGAFDLSVDSLSRLDSKGMAREYPNEFDHTGEMLPPPTTVHPPRYDLASWPPRWTPLLMIVVLVAMLLAVPLLLAMDPRPFNRFKLFVKKAFSDDKKQQEEFRQILFGWIDRWLSDTPFAFVVSIFVAAVFVVFYIIPHRLEAQPLAPFDRVSVWPTEALRLIAALLCFHFVLKIWVQTRQSNREVQQHFKLKSLDEGYSPSNTQTFKPERPRRTLRINKWKVLGHEDGPQSPGDRPERIVAQRLWWEYLRHGSFSARLVRSLLMALVFFAFAYSFAKAWGLPSKPIRGETLAVIDSNISMSSFFLFIWLTFFVLDATLINITFISHLTPRLTNYPYGAFDCEQFTNLGLAPGSLDATDLTEFADIRLIATRTKVVGELAYYPFLIFFLIVVARSSLFADWKWPGSAILILLICLAVAVVGLLQLRAAAENARRQALKRIDQRIVAARGDEPKAKALGKIRELVEGEREGAFSMLSNHPYLAALLLPSGSIGVWALLEYAARHAHG